MRSPITPDDLIEAADHARAHLESFLDRDWSTHAGPLEWDCRHTLDHISTAVVGYSGSLAVADRVRGPGLRKADADAPPAELLQLMTRAARVLAAVARSSEPEARGFHPAGLADAEGFLAIACDEFLIHTHDISTGMGKPLEIPEPIATKLVARLFPWAPEGEAPVSALLWANDRIQLPGIDPIGNDWYWQCAPLEEWDGKIVRRVM